MGFYINVEAKKGCSRQINSAWKKLFGETLVHTPGSIKKEIQFIKNDPKQKHLNFITSVKEWDQAFPSYANGKGQIFIRAYGYSEEKFEKFVTENPDLIAKVKFTLDHRFLFKRISGLQDAADALGMDIDGDYIEDGKLEYEYTPSFSKLPDGKTNPVYIKCLKLDRPDIWEIFLKYADKKELWEDLRRLVILKDSPLSPNSSIWQRCESIAQARGDSYNYSDMLSPPSEFDVIKSILLSEDEFENHLIILKRSRDGVQQQSSSNNVIQFKAA